MRITLARDVAGENEHGCPFIGQTVEVAVSDDSWDFVAQALGISIEELRAQL